MQVSFNQPDTGESHLGRGNLGHGINSTGLSHKRFCGGIVLTDDLYGRPQPTADGATPGQVVLHYMRKQSEEVTEPVSSIFP